MTAVAIRTDTLEARGLSVHFAGLRAVDEVDLTVYPERSGPHRTERRRQDDDRERADRLPAAYGRPHRARRRRRHRLEREPARAQGCVQDVPVGAPVPRLDRARERADGRDRSRRVASGSGAEDRIARRADAARDRRRPTGLGDPARTGAPGRNPRERSPPSPSSSCSTSPAPGSTRAKARISLLRCAGSETSSAAHWP